jgi:hypothetical protein
LWNFLRNFFRKLKKSSDTTKAAAVRTECGVGKNMSKRQQQQASERKHSVVSAGAKYLTGNFHSFLTAPAIIG